MFKGFKIFFNFILRPTKLASSTFFNKRKKTNVLLKPLKYGLMFFGGIIGFGLFIILFSEGIQYVDGNRYVKNYVKNVDGSAMKPNNPDGSRNGLNLLLIDSIKTEGYVKEYLSLARDLEEGKIGPLQVYPGVARTLGVAATEQGSYPGLPLLGSVLPLGNDGPIWNKANSMTLSLANSEVLNKNGYTESFGIVSNNTGSYFGGWQVALSYMSTLSKSSLNKWSSLDGLFFPDQMYAFAQVRDGKYSVVDNYFGKGKISDGARDMATSILYSGSPIFKYIPGENPDEQAANLEEIYKWTHDNFVDYYMDLVDIESLSKGSAAKFVAIMINVRNSGKISQETYEYCMNSYQYNICQAILDKWGISKTVEEFLSPAVDSSLERQGNYSGIMSNVINGKLYFMVPESTGHYIGEEVLGNYYYGSMLKYAGVDVDPTDPNTYMNTIPDGEWKPTGNSAWMGEYGLNPSEIGPQRTSMLNEAVKWIGSWYSNHNPPTPPVKDDSGEWIRDESSNGFDCSSFVQYAYKTALNIDISRTTWTQRANPNTYVIDKSEAKAGDLIYYYDSDPSDGYVLDWGHVAIYINENTILHSPQLGRRIEFTQWDGTPEYQIKEYRRVKGVN